jgi:hypothetical protein
MLVFWNDGHVLPSSILSVSALRETIQFQMVVSQGYGFRSAMRSLRIAKILQVWERAKLTLSDGLSRMGRLP